MKKIILFIAVFIQQPLLNKVSAQQYMVPYIQVGYMGWFSSSKDLNAFFTSYNASQGTALKTGFKSNSGFMTGFKIMGGGRFEYTNGYLELGIGGSRMFASQNVATFRNGDSRILDITGKEVGLDVGFGWGKKVTFGFLFNLGYQNMYIRTGYQYANGSLSYGNSHILNGNYNGDRLCLFSGISMQFRLVQYLWLGFDGGWYGTLLPNDKFTYDDVVDHKEGNALLYFPKDYGVALFDPFNNENDAVNNLRGFRFNINLRFQLSLSDD